MLELPSFLKSLANHYKRCLIPQVWWRDFARHYSYCKRSRKELRALKNKYAGETIFCVGLGSSLASQDLSLLNGQIVLGTNGAFQLLEQFQPSAYFNVLQDCRRFDQFAPVVKDRPEKSFVLCFLDPDYSIKFTSFVDKFLYIMPVFSWIPSDYAIKPLRWPLDERKFEFSDNIEKCAATGCSVIFGAMQIAYYLGAKRIVLLGVDMNYTGDVNKDYAVKGAVHIASINYERDAKPMFENFLSELNKRGVELINSTAGGKLDCVPRQTLEAVVGK